MTVVFAWQNSTVVTVYFLAGRFEASIALLVMVALLLGIFIGVLTLLPSFLKRSWQLRKEIKRFNRLQGKINIKNDNSNDNFGNDQNNLNNN